MRAHRRRGAGVGGYVEAPGLDAAVPVRHHEGHVGLAARLRVSGGDARRHEVAGQPVLVATGFRHGFELGETHHAAGVGTPLAQQAPAAVAHRDGGIGHRLAVIERRDPRQAAAAAVVLVAQAAAQLEMHTQVGHQRSGAHIHRRALAEQRLAQHRRSDLDHVEARLGQRDADHLERPRAAARWFGYGQLLHAGRALEQRHRARLDRHRVARVVDAVRRAARQHRVELAAGIAGLMHAAHQAQPLHHRGIVVHAQLHHRAGTRLDATHGKIGLDIAQRHRQQRRIVGGRLAARQFAEALHHAERRGGELGQRRHGCGGDLEREQVGIGQRAAAVVLQVLRYLDGELRLLGERRGKGQSADAGVGRQVGIDLRRALAGRCRQHHLLGLLARHRGRERDRHRPQRRARRLRVLALAAEAGGKGFAHGVVKAALVARGHSRRRGDARAEHQLHARRGRQPLLAGKQVHGIGRRPGQFGPVDRLEQVVAFLAGEQPHRDALAQPLRLAPRVLAYRRRRGRAVEAQRKDLVFLDLAAGRPAGDHGRAAGLEAVFRLAGIGGAGDALQPGAHAHAAAHPGRQVAGEIVDPVPGIDPAGLAAGAGAGAGHRGGRGGLHVAHRHHGLVEADRHLPDLSHRAFGREAGDLGGIGGLGAGKQRERGAQRQCRSA
ncbi:hypothetical protein D9M69_359230 [compost metagenome]